MISSRSCFLTLVALIVTINAFASCSDWDKLIQYKNVVISDAVRDRFGDLYVVGSFHLQDFTLGGYTFTLPPGSNGTFVAKFDKNYSLVWATNPVSERAYASEIEVDLNNNIVVAGNYYTSINFGCIQLSGTGRSDIFVVSYTSDGIPLWATASSGADDESPVELTVSPNGNIILASIFVEKSSVTPWLTVPNVAMGGVPVITGANDQVNAGYDSFIACILPTGTVAWTQGIGGDGNEYDYVRGIATDLQNNVIITGYFSSPQISFDGHVVHRFTTSENYFLAKIDANGQTLWVHEGEGGVNQSGFGVDTDNNDNIFVVGRFYGDTRFGTINLANRGEADVFAVKVSPTGTVLTARAIGNDDFDSGTEVEVDSNGRVLVSAYYYSDYLEIGPYNSTKPDFEADSFIATFSNDLATVECSNFITGDASSIVWKFELDPADNALVMVNLDLGIGIATFGSQNLSGSDYWSTLAIIGNNPAPDEGNPSSGNVSISLGADKTICNGEKIILTAGLVCDALYLWSTGSTDASIEVTQQGVYWVEVTSRGQTFRDEVEVFYEPLMNASLGDDKDICPGEVVTWSLPRYHGASYLWNDGSNAETKTVTTSGSYWVKISNKCQIISDTITINVKPALIVDLGDDRIICDNKEITLTYNPVEYESIEWSDGSVASTLTVAVPGAYSIAVSNGCTTATDEVVVVAKFSPGVELGDEQQLCNGKDVILNYDPVDGETIQWSNGSTSATLPITKPGTYSISVTNVCGIAHDEVLVTMKDLTGVIPNVITSNGDDKNEHFILPASGQQCSLAVYNRWGENIFYASAYENNWPQTDLSSGVYFYHINGICISDKKGMIQLLR